MGVNNNISLGVGNISFETELGRYYQDLTPAIYHFENNSLGQFDEQGIPYLVETKRKYYSIIYVIQYALIQHDFILQGNNVDERKRVMKNCVEWLTNKSEEFQDAIVWRSEENEQYKLKKGWVSAMYQGQAISLYLRTAQMFNEPEHVEFAKKIFNFFKYDFSEGGATRIDKNGYKWLEEYPTDPPSYVLNGFVYSIFGILDLYRVTKMTEAKNLYDECILTLTNNVYKYDRFYWSVYDQLKRELVSFYYQKNVHIPLMKILFLLTGEKVFDKLDKKWSRQLNSKFCLITVQIMYRIQPRMRKLFK